MKYFFTLVTCMFLAGQLTAQYLPVNEARQLIRNAKTPKEKFNGYRGLDRYYYTTGLYDSSAMLQTKMYALAEGQKDDSLMTLVYVSIGNRYVTKTDYNFSLTADFKALEYANTKRWKAILCGNIAYVYACTGNNQLALDYLKKSHAIGDYSVAADFRNVFYGIVYNNLNLPDSALVHLQMAANTAPKSPDPTFYSMLLAQTGKTYELKGDTDLAEVYYKRVLAYCKQHNLASGQIKHGDLYCDFSIKAGKYQQAKIIAIENLAVAKKAGINEGISTVAEILRKIYAHSGNKDSAYYYAVMQINYKDSVSNQKRIAEFQNITFNQQLRELDEQSKANEANEQRRLNIQYAAIALGLVVFIMLFLLLSRSVMVNTRMIEIVGVIGLLIVFEFINLVVHPYLVSFTNDSPMLMLLILVLIAAIIVPLHHKLEGWIKHKLVEKNKIIRLAAAKRTIEKLEGGAGEKV
jgi:tetratricopeptide (TPR) repeat protein